MNSYKMFISILGLVAAGLTALGVWNATKIDPGPDQDSPEPGDNVSHQDQPPRESGGPGGDNFKPKPKSPPQEPQGGELGSRGSFDSQTREYKAGRRAAERAFRRGLTLEEGLEFTGSKYKEHPLFIKAYKLVYKRLEAINARQDT